MGHRPVGERSLRARRHSNRDSHAGAHRIRADYPWRHKLGDVHQAEGEIMSLIPIRFDFPWWVPPIGEESEEKYWGLKLDKPYWFLSTKFLVGLFGLYIA